MNISDLPETRVIVSLAPLLQLSLASIPYEIQDSRKYSLGGTISLF